MRAVTGRLVLCLGCVWLGVGTADWMTNGGDAQRSSWIRTDQKISSESMQKPGFAFLWKIKLKSDPLTPLVSLDRYIGYRGFRTLGFVGGSADNVFAIDTDLGRLEWLSHLPSAAARPGDSPGCTGGMTANLARPTTAAFPTFGGGRGFGGGRSGPARSGVGEPGQGAVTLAQTPIGRGVPPPPPAAPPGAPGAPRRTPAYNPFGRGPAFVHALSSDGMFHSMYVSNGVEPKPPVKFLPPNANAQGLIVADNVAYTATTQGCGGVANGVWALDIESRQVATWKANGGIAGSAGPAIGPDGTLYVATSEGELVALQAGTLHQKGSYKAGQPFTSSPVIFEYKQKTLIAAATKDGRIHLLDSAALATPLHKTPANAKADGAASALASWQDAAGTRWLLAAATGIAAWKLVEENGGPALQPGWVSREMASPLPPMVMNGVVFAASGGGQRSSGAVLYALDAARGKELWSSGGAIASPVRGGGGISAGGSQVYLGTSDGTLYAFGFPIEH